jgi:3-hydroxybutyryl-CoA dehydratase
MTLVERKFNEIQVGDSYTFNQTWSADDVDAFARLSGDHNPLHTDTDYASGTQFKKRVVHGMLVASSISKLLGMYVPGKYCLYLQQSITFKKPTFIGDELTITGTVVSKSNATKILSIDVQIYRGDEKIIEGESKVQVTE